MRKVVMYRDNGSTHPESSPQELYRGLYVRIARKLRVDPSYVSRVARGDRRSQQIEDALSRELERINSRLGRGSNRAGDRASSKANSGERLGMLMGQNRPRIRKEWLKHSNADPRLRSVKVAVQKRAAPILPVVEEALKVMKLGAKLSIDTPMKAAQKHGRARKAQGFSPIALIEEYNLMRRCVFGIAEKHCHRMDARLLIQDLARFGEALDLQTQHALRDYLAAN